MLLLLLGTLLLGHLQRLLLGTLQVASGLGRLQGVNRFLGLACSWNRESGGCRCTRSLKQ